MIVPEATIKPYLANHGHNEHDVNAMHLAWTKSIQMQIALWSKPYMDLAQTKNEW